MNISPSIAVQLNKYISISGGPDIQYFNIDTEAMDRTQALTFGDSESKIMASDLADGWHAGVLVQVTPTTRIGASYHLEIKHDLEGISDFYLTPGIFQPFTTRNYNSQFLQVLLNLPQLAS